jgi:hypothetical protein
MARCNPGYSRVDPMINFKYKENLSGLLAAMAKKSQSLAPVVRKHAINIQANSMISPPMPVKTGNLKNSMKVTPVDSTHFEIHDQTDYGVFQELGTSRGVSAKHFLGGAAEREAEPFFEEIRKVLSE